MADYTKDLSDSLSISEIIKKEFNVLLSETITYAGYLTSNLQCFFEGVSIEETQTIKICSPDTVKQSKYGTFKYGQRKYGKRVEICEEILDISGNVLLKVNDSFVHTLEDNISFSESLVKQIDYKLDLSDSISLSESLVDAHGIKRTLSDSLSVIIDSLANQINAGISDTLSFSLLLETDFTEGKTYKSLWRFIIVDENGDRVASLVNARDRWFVQRLNNQSEAGFILDADDDKCNTDILKLGINELQIYHKEKLMWAGQLASANKIARGDDIYWKVIAKDWVALLSKRFCGVESLREFTTTDAGEIAWTLINETQSLTYGDFGITQGTVESSITRSPSYDKKNILKAIIELSNMGEDGSSSYGFDFEITPEKEFNVYYPYMGEIKENVVFRYPGNCENFEAFVDSWGIVNHEWGMGKHWTGNTALISRDDATSQDTYGRREAVKNYSDMSVLSFMQDMVWQDIQWLKDPSTVVKFKSREDKKTQIEDYDVGDGVTVVCDKFNISEWLWVYERKIEINENDEIIVNLTLGN